MASQHVKQLKTRTHKSIGRYEGVRLAEGEGLWLRMWAWLRAQPVLRTHTHNAGHIRPPTNHNRSS